MTRRDLTSPYYPGGGNTNEQVTVFHSLNGSDAKGTTGPSNPSRRKQKGYPKVFYPRDTITAQIQRPVVTHLPNIPTGPPFLFRSPEPLFLLLTKEKAVLAPAGQAKTNCKIKHPAFPQEKKQFHPQDAHPIHKVVQPGNIRLPFPKTTHPGGVNTNEQGAVFHPLNGSGAKGTTGRSNASRRR